MAGTKLLVWTTLFYLHVRLSIFKEVDGLAYCPVHTPPTVWNRSRCLLPVFRSGLGFQFLLMQRFLTLLEVLSPRIFIHAFTKPFRNWKNKMISSKHRYIFYQCTNEPCISCTQNHSVERTKATKHDFQTKKKKQKKHNSMNI